MLPAACFTRGTRHRPGPPRAPISRRSRAEARRELEGTRPVMSSCRLGLRGRRTAATIRVRPRRRARWSPRSNRNCRARWAFAAAPAACAALELVERLDRQLRQDELRDGRISRSWLLHHREARGRRAQRRGRSPDPQDCGDQDQDAAARKCQPGSSTRATPTWKCTEATGRSSRPGSRPAVTARRYGISLRVRRSDLPPGERLLEGHHPLTAVGQRTPTDSSRASPTVILACRAAAFWIRAATSSAYPSAGCRATTASRSFCRSAPR